MTVKELRKILRWQNGNLPVKIYVGNGAAQRYMNVHGEGIYVDAVDAGFTRTSRDIKCIEIITQ